VNPTCAEIDRLNPNEMYPADHEHYGWRNLIENADLVTATRSKNQLKFIEQQTRIIEAFKNNSSSPAQKLTAEKKETKKLEARENPAQKKEKKKLEARETAAQKKLAKDKTQEAAAQKKLAKDKTQEAAAGQGGAATAQKKLEKRKAKQIAKVTADFEDYVARKRRQQRNACLRCLFIQESVRTGGSGSDGDGDADSDAGSPSDVSSGSDCANEHKEPLIDETPCENLSETQVHAWHVKKQEAARALIAPSPEAATARKAAKREAARIAAARKAALQVILKQNQAERRHYESKTNKYVPSTAHFVAGLFLLSEPSTNELLRLRSLCLSSRRRRERERTFSARV
jgi:hypothetical protein